MWRSALIGVLSFPFSALAFAAGWAARDLRFGVLAGAAVFTAFFAAFILSLFFIKTYTYLDAALPFVFSILWSAVLVPFSFGTSLFSAPDFIGAAFMLGGCMVVVKYRQMDRRWLVLPAIVFVYEMMPVNIPGQFDDMFALAGSVGYTLTLFLKRALPQILREAARKRTIGHHKGTL